MPEKEKPEATPKSADDRLTPEQWARRKGLFVEAKSPNESHFHWSHAAADTLHGWASHAHHAGEPMKLYEHDYDAAIKAVTDPDKGVADEKKKTGRSKAHKPAMSPHCTHDGGHRKD
jgi:hypothetical protein